MREFIYKYAHWQGYSPIFTEEEVITHREQGLYRNSCNLFELVPREIKTKTITVQEIV